MIIDCHVHIGAWMRRFDGSEGDPVPEMVARARLHGIERLWVSSLGTRGYTADAPIEDVRASNDFVRRAIAAFPESIQGLCYVNPRHGQAALDEIERCVADGPFVGIKLWISCKANDPLVDPILERAAELGAPVLQHAWYKRVGQMEFESTPAEVAEAGRRHPGVSLIMAHLMGAGERGVLEIAPVPNVLVDTSGGDPEGGLVEYAVRQLGAERVVFGSDAPGRSYGVQLGKVLAAGITPEQRELILHGNHERISRR